MTRVIHYGVAPWHANIDFRDPFCRVTMSRCLTTVDTVKSGKEASVRSMLRTVMSSERTVFIDRRR